MKRPVSFVDYNFHCIPGAKYRAKTKENLQIDENLMTER